MENPHLMESLTRPVVLWSYLLGHLQMCTSDENAQVKVNSHGQSPDHITIEPCQFLTSNTHQH